MSVYEFGPFRLDTSERLLTRAGTRVPITEKAFDTLTTLVRHSGRLVTKEQLLKEVWQETVVEENSLDKSISAVRQALGDKVSAPDYVETVRGRGYRFLVEILKVNGEVASTETSGVAPKSDFEPVSSIPPLRAAHRVTVSFAVIAALAAMSLVTYSWWTKRSKVNSSSLPRLIAVLPFQPLTAAAHDESLEMGMADTLITKLDAVRQITVRPISAVRRYASQEQDPVKAGKELGVDAVIDGSIQRDQDRVRATVRLIRVVDSASLWSGTFDQRFADVFSVQDAISNQVVQSLRLTLSPTDQHLLTKRYTESSEAYQLYLKGRFFWAKRTEDDTRKSIDFFKKAVAVDANYALAYSGLADAYWTLHILGQSETYEGLRAQAQQAAAKALNLDESLAEAHTSLGEIREVFDLDFPGAEREYLRALDLDPNSALAHQRYAFLLTRQGRTSEAVVEFDRALSLDPVSALITTDAARPFIRTRDYYRAVEQLKKALEIDPGFPRAHNLLALCYTRLGRFDEATAEAKKATQLSSPKGAEDENSYQLAYIYAVSNRKEDAWRIVRELESAGARHNDQLYTHALVCLALGERDKALSLAEQLYQTRNIDLVALKFDPAWDELRDDPRFKTMLTRF